MSGFKNLKCLILFLFLCQPVLAGESIIIEGSTTLYPVIKKCATAFMKEYGDVKIVMTASGSGNGIKSLIQGQSDIATGSRFLKDKEIKLAIEKGAYPITFCIAYDCIVPVVHRKNPLENISLQQLKNIYTGKISNWHSLNGKDAEITTTSRDLASGTYEVWRDRILNHTSILPSVKLALSSESVIDIISKDDHSIGYVGLGFLSKRVKALKVEGITATEKTAINGSFPINRPLYLFTKGWPKGYTLKFINYALNPSKGQQFVKSSGFVGLYYQDGENRPFESSLNQNKKRKRKLLYREYKTMEWPDKIKLVQEYLKDLEYEVGPVDGIYGPHTAWSIRKFQSAQELSADGQVSYELIQELERILSANNDLFTGMSYGNYPYNHLS